MGEGKTTLASERARYWVKRLQRQGWPSDEQPLPFLSSVAKDAELGMAQIGIDIAGGAGQRLLDWLITVAGRDIPEYGVFGDANESQFLEVPQPIGGSRAGRAIPRGPESGHQLRKGPGSFVVARRARSYSRDLAITVVDDLLTS